MQTNVVACSPSDTCCCASILKLHPLPGQLVGSGGAARLCMVLVNRPVACGCSPREVDIDIDVDVTLARGECNLGRLHWVTLGYKWVTSELQVSYK